jgi:hypothetical protein
MQSKFFEDALPWNDAEIIKTLTSPAIAKVLWRSASPAAEHLRHEFGGCEHTFMAYVAALHERSSAGPIGAKADWQAYSEQARTIAQ